VRDFTYIDDIIESLVRLLDKPAAADPGFDPINPDSATSLAPQRVYTSATPIRSC
jgi:UDP-glucuronate 4-epimerase